MLTLHADFTNAEAEALAPLFAEIEQRLVRKLRLAEPKPLDKSALAWAAFQKLAVPVRQHLTRLEELKKEELRERGRREKQLRRKP